MRGVLLRRASTAPGVEHDVALLDGWIVDVADLPTGHEQVDLAGRPLLPGLADHHVHLFALAAARASVDLSPGALREGGGLDAVLHAARARQPSGWLRGVGYDVDGSGPLDRDRLDALGVGPIRIQDRTGILWMLDSRALDDVLPSDPRDRPDGAEVVGGQPSGVLRRLDHWLGHRVPAPPIDLAAVGADLAARGVVALTDAGATNGPADLAALAAAGLPQRLMAMTADVEVDPVEGLDLGPVKVLLDDVDLPSLDDLAARIAAAHGVGRAVAVHCVTEVQVALALAAGIGAGDRVEHASLVPDDLLRALVAAGPQVVVQPALVWARGDRYLDQVDPADRPGLHRLASFVRAGLRVSASSDAPYGPSDPWRAVAAGVDRRTAGGRTLGTDEALSPGDAVGLMAGRLDDPSARREAVPGHTADLVVLDATWSQLASQPTVATTVVAGEVIHGDWPE